MAFALQLAIFAARNYQKKEDIWVQFLHSWITSPTYKLRKTLI
jgi:hypothetical protein